MWIEFRGDLATLEKSAEKMAAALLAEEEQTKRKALTKVCIIGYNMYVYMCPLVA